LKEGEHKMKKIITSLMAVVLAGSVLAGATYAYFSSQATVENNTFATGTLEIRVNGQPTILGATFNPMAPGQEGISPVYGLQNYGAPWFGGPSNLTAKKLLLSVANENDDNSGLWQEVKIKVEVGRLSGVMQYTLYEGKLKNMGVLDLFGGHWTELIPGSSQDFRYTVYLPETNTNQNQFMGKTLTWDFVIEGRTN
jgi:predicted ribosomally synthesized peptide with SipW-like signal peptide